MGPDVPLDTIIKKFTIVYGNVKSFDLLMRDFYRADQGEEESIPSFATWVEGLLSQIHDKFPEKLTPQRNRDSSRIACSMDVRRVSGTVSSTALLILT